MTLPVLNYSFVRDFKNCPHKAYRRYVLKDVEFVSTPKMAEGRQDHNELAARVSRGTELPRWLQHAEPICRTFDSIPKTARVKVEWFGGIKVDGSPCAWDDKACWFRTKPDVAVITPAGGWLVDWKTGRRWEDPFELETQALLLHAHHPETKIWQGEYYWLADECVGERYDLSPANAYASMSRDYAAMQLYQAQDNWPKKPNKLCSWCDVRDCEHAKKQFATMPARRAG